MEIFSISQRVIIVVDSIALKLKDLGDEMKREMSFTEFGMVENLQVPTLEEALLKKSPRIEGQNQIQDAELICPEDLKQLILEEMKKEEEAKKRKMKMKPNLGKKLRLRVHYKLEVKTICISSKKKFREFRESVFKKYKITDTQNCRMRLFNRLRDEMLSDFKGKDEISLQKLKINSVKSFIIEEKLTEEIFEDYDPHVGKHILLNHYRVKELLSI